MEDKKGKKEEHGFDESLLDPRLRVGSPKTPDSKTKADTKAASLGPVLSPTETVTAPVPVPVYVPLADPWWDTFEDDIVDEHTVFPESAYKSLDYIIASQDIRGDERSWLMGLQAGIGLGIHSAREAVLNEMQNESTVFGRQIQKEPSDPHPYRLRMDLGRRCRTGFDRRVAYRAANRFVRNCGRVADMVVHNSVTTSCLPETANSIMGTSMFFSEEDVARCHSVSRKIDEFFGIAKDQPQSSLYVKDNSSTNQPTPLAASILGDGLRNSSVDMTQLIDTDALISNAVTYKPTPTLALMNCEPSQYDRLTGMDAEYKVMHNLCEALWIK